MGMYRSTCRVPGNFLNNGCFRISLNIFGKGFSDSMLAHDVLSFEVHDSAFLRGDYHGDFAGAIRPALEWFTEATGKP
jgi:lipopolysaccharide transport system ATP-binding protein